VEQHCSNPKCFKEKNYKATHPDQYEKNKIDKDNSGKTNHKKMKKKPCGEHYSNLQCFKEKKLQS
jgi:hypothetical protein